MTEPNTTILRADHITKRFPGVTALNDVTCDIYKGKVNAIVGENGAGKSTLMNILAGVHQDYNGQLFLDDEPVAFENPKAAQNHGIAIIHQELNLIPYLSVAENIFLGREVVNRCGFLDSDRMHFSSRDSLEQLNLSVEPTTPVAELRVGAQQIVEIAKALSLNARIIIMDEPTSALSDQETEILFKLIRNVTAKNVTIIYITHKLDELFQIGDHVTILRDGRYISSRPLSELTQDDIVRQMVGRDVQKFFIKDHEKSEDIVFAAENMSLAHPTRKGDYLVKNASFSVKKGEVFGLFGLMGAGRTELLETIFGIHPRSSFGQIYIDNKRVNNASPQKAIEAGIGLVPEDRKQEGLILNMTVAENISLVCLKDIEENGFLNSRREQDVAADYANKLNIKTPTVKQIVNHLSGGNQQKVVLAKWLTTSPKVLLLDEPTRGIDINAKNEIYQLINELAESGLAIVMVSSELPEILAIADRIGVMAMGRITGVFSQQEASEEKLLKAAIVNGQ